MGEGIRIRIGEQVFDGELNDSLAAAELYDRLPTRFSLRRWGDEFYGDVGFEPLLTEHSREVMQVGEIAIWPPGKAFCIFFGPTPASEGREPRAASLVEPIGRLEGDWGKLRQQSDSVEASAERLP